MHATPAAAHWTQRLARAWLRRGLLATLLLPIAWVYAAVVRVRRFAYAAGVLRTARLPVPVVVVGNLIAGGAGKTPTVLAVVDALRVRGWHPGIVSRGHGRRGDTPRPVARTTPAADCGDEPLLLHRRSGAPVVVGRDRVAAARRLLQLDPDVDVVVCDDGLQHLALARDVQVIVFDERGVGNGWLLPAGPLREALPRRVPARSLLLYNAARPTTPLPGYLARRGLAGALPLADWWRGAPPSAEVLAALSGRRVVAAAGVAQPERFFTLLREAGLAISPLPLPDHHPFATLPWPQGTADVIVTEKDAVKIDAARAGTSRIWVAALDLRPDPAFADALAALLPAPRARDGNPTA